MAELDPTFAAHRPRLFAIAYRMLGSVAAAEDIVQEAWLRLRDTDPAGVRNADALLRTVVVRLCLDELKSARRARESYIGPWLPEPLRAEPPDTPAAADERIDEIESLSMAFLLMLEALSPLERAAFLLREVFDYGFDELAVVLGRSEPACRQLCHRARSHIEARRSRFHVPKAQHMEMMQAFLGAIASGDVTQMSQMLCTDVVMTSDGGGEVRAARKEVHGRHRVARFLIGVARRGVAGTTSVLTWLNGYPAVIFSRDGEVMGALIVEHDGKQATAVRFVLTPRKLQHL
jgi:RNA polymerase sigma-70 factor (ECF subfamily)